MIVTLTETVTGVVTRTVTVTMKRDWDNDSNIDSDRDQDSDRENDIGSYSESESKRVSDTVTVTIAVAVTETRTWRVTVTATVALTETVTVTKTKNPTPERKTAEFKSTAVLPCIKGVSELLRRHLLQQGIRTVFKSDTTLRSRLVRPKDPADPNKQDGIVYKIPCTCGKVYIGETGRPMQEGMKEHDRDLRLAPTQNSGVSEHANGTGHKPLCN
ncbi:hypothetical protein AWC38_SpisGene720 [Stylophora pistillata]|uniref:GIY-YIG domain-containing protein n=1 Tax=Stylophora pistillata TaxID=50429 RepID=A0A2B4SV15_STYPI|nr:hypothetical protein AWC38_SpisGene720 [Stylophora pistillata]